MASSAHGLSPERLGQLDRHLDESYVAPGKFAGTVTLVARHGEIAHLACLGQMDAERGRPMTEDTIFRLASITKPITSVALLTLYEEGRFQLTDPVHQFIPEFDSLEVWESGDTPPFKTRPPARPMTVHDLLTHQSGLTYYFHGQHPVDAAYRSSAVFYDVQGERGATATLAENVGRAALQPPLFDPGSAWNYSIATDVCGHLIAVLAGMDCDEYLDQMIFGPLGMPDTGFHVPPATASRLAAAYAPTPDGRRTLLEDPESSPLLQPTAVPSGGGGLVSTAQDYFRFAQMLCSGGLGANGVRILSRKTVELMTQNHLTGGGDLASHALSGQFTESAYMGRGLGTLLDPAQAQVSGSPGTFFWGGAYSTWCSIDPVEELVLVFLTQLRPSSTYPVRMELQTLVNAAIDD